MPYNSCDAAVCLHPKPLEPLESANSCTDLSIGMEWPLTIHGKAPADLTVVGGDAACVTGDSARTRANIGNVSQALANLAQTVQVHLHGEEEQHVGGVEQLLGTGGRHPLGAQARREAVRVHVVEDPLHDAGGDVVDLHHRQHALPKHQG